MIGIYTDVWHIRSCGIAVLRVYCTRVDHGLPLSTRSSRGRRSFGAILLLATDRPLRALGRHRRADRSRTPSFTGAPRISRTHRRHRVHVMLSNEHTPVHAPTSGWRARLTKGDALTGAITLALATYLLYVHANNKCDMASILLVRSRDTSSDVQRKGDDLARRHSDARACALALDSSLRGSLDAALAPPASSSSLGSMCSLSSPRPLVISPR
jgi:hypothetical protein